MVFEDATRLAPRLLYLGSLTPATVNLISKQRRGSTISISRYDQTYTTPKKKQKKKREDGLSINSDDIPQFRVIFPIWSKEPVCIRTLVLFFERRTTKRL